MVIMKPDPSEQTANGFTNIMEAMALGLPVIVTKTGAMPGELDVEKSGCGFFVPPEDPGALAMVMDRMASERERARTMGEAGYRLCENHYNLKMMASRLHALFETL